MKHYWLVFWLEKWPDGTVQAFKTAVHCETIAKALEAGETELRIRTKNNGTEYLLYDVALADRDVADLVGKAETDALGIEWPE